MSLTRSSQTFDTASRETGWKVGNTAYSRVFSGAGQMTGWGAGPVSGTLSYDATARKSRDTLSAPLGAGIDQTYAYTDEGRLAGVRPSAATTTTFAFDAAGNLTTETAGASTKVMRYDPNTQRLIDRTADSTVTNYAFDGFGQRIAQGPAWNPNKTRFGYTNTGRLASYATSSGVLASYSYDASGQRTQSVFKSGGVTTTVDYVYEGLNLLSLTAAQSTGTTWSVSYLYDAEGRPYAGVYASGAASPTVFQVVTTDRGDVVQLLDTSGAAFAAYRYDVWGVPSVTTSAATGAVTLAVASAITSRQPLRYAGYVYDEHSGLYYLSARSYDPVTRQFISKDSAKDDGEESAYQYAGGDPVGKVDPSGKVSVWTAAAVVLAVVFGYLTWSTFKKIGYYRTYRGQKMLLVGYRKWLWANKRTRYWSLQSTSKLHFGVYHQYLGSNEKRAAAVYYSGQNGIFHLYVFRVFKWDLLTSGVPTSLPTRI